MKNHLFTASRWRDVEGWRWSTFDVELVTDFLG
jgi:hypothetical protein